jgi:hypothetical protein
MVLKDLMQDASLIGLEREKLEAGLRTTVDPDDADGCVELDHKAVHREPYQCGDYVAMG